MLMHSLDWHTLVSVNSLHRHLHDPQLVIVDCRFELGKPDAARRAWLQAHLPGARYADLEQDLSGTVSATSGRHPLPDVSALSTRLGNWGIDEQVQVVAYDADNGSMAAARLWWLLRWLGHPRVAVLDGGLKAWQAAGLPVDDVPVPATPRQFRARPHHDWVSSSQDVHTLLHESSWRIVDARAPERYAGQVEPIDPVAGHIPGAINHPLARNLHSNGHFLSAEILRAQWLAVLGNTAPSQVISSCGSGVTACHNLLALEVAGLSGAKLHAGSWSEWCKQPGYPIRTGAQP